MRLALLLTLVALVPLCLAWPKGHHGHGHGHGHEGCNSGQEGGDCGGEADQSDRTLDSQKLRLEALKDKLSRFRAGATEKLGEAEQIQRDIGVVKTRLHALEDSGCDDRHFLQCGGDKPLCLSRLLVCDTWTDCANGRDESDCDILMPSGSVWTGKMVYDHCTKSRPNTIRVTIDNYKIVDYFRPFPLVTASVEMDYDQPGFTGERVELTGWMDLMPGDHVLYTQPPDNDGLAMTCTFDGTDRELCRGRILHENTQAVCAEFYLSRKDRH